MKGRLFRWMREYAIHLMLVDVLLVLAIALPCSTFLHTNLDFIPEGVGFVLVWVLWAIAEEAI